MTLRAATPALRLPAVVGVSVVLACTTGCVYWRVSSLRHQVSDFTRHCTLTFEPGPVVGFNKPVLKPADLVWLTGVEPTRKDETAWVYAFRLRRPQPEGEPDPRDRIEVMVGLREGRVSFVQIPEAFNVMITPDLLEGAFAGASKADVNRIALATGWVLPSTLPIPTPGEIRAMFGEPGNISETAMHSVWTYAYDAERFPEGEGNGEPDAFAMFVFNRERALIEQAHLRMGMLHGRVRKEPNGRFTFFVQRRGS